MGNRFACMATMRRDGGGDAHCTFLELRVVRRGAAPPDASTCLMQELTWACAVDAMGPRYCSERHVPATTVLEASPFAQFVHDWFAAHSAQGSGAHRLDVLGVNIVCDPAVALGDLLRSPDAVLQFGIAAAEECSTTSKRNAVAAFMTLVGAGVYLTGPLADRMRFAKPSTTTASTTTHVPHALHVTVLDASFNALHDSDCHWIAVDLLDRCERSREGIASAPKYVARLVEMATAANAVEGRMGGSEATPHAALVNALDPLPNERMLHAFSNASCGPHVQRLALQGARLTTLGLSRLLRTVFQTAVPNRRQVSPTTSTTSESLVCQSLALVDLRGPWTDASTTSLRVVDEAMERLCRLQGELPEVLVATCIVTDDHRNDYHHHEVPDEVVASHSAVEGTHSEAPSAMHAADAVVCSAPTQWGGHSSAVPPQPLTPPKAQRSTVAPVGNASLVDAGYGVAITSPKCHSPQSRCEDDCVEKKQSPAKTYSSAPSPRTTQPVAEVQPLSCCSDQGAGQRFCPSPMTSEVGCNPAEEMELLSHAMRRVHPRCQSLCLEVEEAATRAKRFAATWQNGFLRHVDGLVALVARAPNAVPLKSDGIVSEYRSATCQAVVCVDAVLASLHAAAGRLVQCLQGAVHDESHDDAPPNRTARAFAENVGLSLATLQSTDPGMLWMEDFLQSVDASDPHTTSLGRLTASDSTAILHAVTATLRPPKERDGSSSPLSQWRAVWKTVLETALLPTSDNGDVELFTSSSLADDCHATAQRILKLLVALRDAAWRLSHEYLLKWSVLWVERWTALLRRWLVEGEIGRRQAVRALHRRTTTAAPTPPTHAQQQHAADVDPAKHPTPKHSGRRTPTRRTSPLGRTLSPKTDPYAHVKAKVSTQRAVPSDNDGTEKATCSEATRTVDAARDSAVAPQAERSVIAERIVLDKPGHMEADAQHMGSPSGSCQPGAPATSPPPPPSAPARNTNSTALRKIVMLEAKLAELEAHKASASPQTAHRRRRKSQASPMSLEDTATMSAAPQPRQGPPPVRMEWSTQSTASAALQRPLPHVQPLYSNNSSHQPEYSNNSSHSWHIEASGLCAQSSVAEALHPQPSLPHRAVPLHIVQGATTASPAEGGLHAAPLFVQHTGAARNAIQEASTGVHNRSTSCTSLGSYFKPTVAGVPPEVEVAHRVIFRPLPSNQQAPMGGGKFGGAAAGQRGVVSDNVLTYILQDGVKRTGQAAPPPPRSASATTTRDALFPGDDESVLQYFTSRSASRVADVAEADDECYCV